MSRTGMGPTQWFMSLNKWKIYNPDNTGERYKIETDWSYTAHELRTAGVQLTPIRG